MYKVQCTSYNNETTVPGPVPGTSAGSAKLKLVQCAQGLVQFAQGISVFLLTTNIR